MNYKGIYNEIIINQGIFTKKQPLNIKFKPNKSDVDKDN